MSENGVERPLKSGERISGLNIKINGNNNLLKLELPIKAENSCVEIGNDNTELFIGSTPRLFSVYIRMNFGNGQVCKIGKGTTIYGANIILDETAACIIGEDCEFSNSIRIWPTDGHSILDAETGEILNKPEGAVTIGNHVWVGEAVRITKNARVGNNCIIGGGAVACKNYGEDNVIIAGNPAKIVRSGISWDRKNPYFLEQFRNKRSDK